MSAATLFPLGAAAREWDVLVVGAGPAGAAAARRLAGLGRRVLLVDRGHFPRPKVCGCCLSPAAVHELEALAIPAGVMSAGVPLEAVRLLTVGGALRIAMTGGRTLSREALDVGLVEAAVEAGAEWLPGLSVTAIDDDDTPVTTARAGNGKALRIRSSIVVIAAGLSDAIRIGSARRRGARVAGSRGRLVSTASRIGLGTTLPAAASDLAGGELVMAVGRGGYVGIVRLEDGRLDVAAAVSPMLIAAGGSPAAALAMLLAEGCGRDRPPVDLDALRMAGVHATPALSHTTPLSAGAHDAIIRIGDAAAYVEPFTGEGIGWALASSRVLADAAADARSPRELVGRYRAAHARLFGSHHARCHGIARAVRRPRLLAGAVHLARIAPGLAARTLPWLVGGGRLA